MVQRQFPSRGPDIQQPAPAQRQRFVCRNLLLAHARPAALPTYSVVISGTCGNSVTNVASLAVNQNVVVASAPQSITNCPGSAATFGINASGTGLNYQWFKGSSPLAGQTSSSLLLPSVSASYAGTCSSLTPDLRLFRPTRSSSAAPAATR